MQSPLLKGVWGNERRSSSRGVWGATRPQVLFQLLIYNLYLTNLVSL